MNVDSSSYYLNHCRHPEATERLSFIDITVLLQKPDFFLLQWSSRDLSTSGEEGKRLGAPLKAGYKLHSDLQKTYVEVTQQIPSLQEAERNNEDFQGMYRVLNRNDRPQPQPGQQESDDLQTMTLEIMHEVMNIHAVIHRPSLSSVLGFVIMCSYTSSDNFHGSYAGLTMSRPVAGGWGCTCTPFQINDIQNNTVV